VVLRSQVHGKWSRENTEGPKFTEVFDIMILRWRFRGIDLEDIEILSAGGMTAQWVGTTPAGRGGD
jgi:hypothetical protein